jgi:predicted RNase H-like HicB family nuclease
MIYDVILNNKDNKYFARIKEWSEIEACGNTRDEARRRVQTHLSVNLQSKWFRLKVSESAFCMYQSG